MSHSPALLAMKKHLSLAQQDNRVNNATMLAVGQGAATTHVTGALL